MFRFSSETLPLSEACLQVLCPSLNAPVLDIDQLPVAPASAAIVVYAEDYGDLALAVGLRSLESGQVALFRHRDPLQSAGEVEVAIEAARSFSEGLGFLFDDDMIALDATTGRHRALVHWNDLMGSPGLVPDAAPAGTAGGELLLDDLVEMAQDDDAEFVLEEEACFAGESPEDFTLSEEAEPAPDAEPSLAAATAERLETVPSPTLTKFRKPAPTASAADPAATPSALGRIPIVKMRQEKDAAKPNASLRLLASF
jgi:hypothetical protein